MKKKSSTGEVRQLVCDLPKEVWSALEERMARTGETEEEAVSSCLCEALDVKRHAIFQVSTSGALVQGVYQGCMKMSEIMEYGDFGLGTFENLDGEGVMLDGCCYRSGSDGSVREVPEDALVPFWVTTRFRADRTEVLDRVESWEGFCEQLDAIRASDNLLAAIRLEGVFEAIRVRVATKTAPGTTLVEATEHQVEFEYENIAGDLVGFFTPDYARAINVPGYHLHLLSKDCSQGGHVLDVRGNDLAVSLHVTSELHMTLPENKAFLQADLHADPAKALAKAEGKAND